MRKIYFAGSITGGRDEAEAYMHMINYMRKYGKIVTEHVGDKGLREFGEVHLSAIEIHDRDIEWLHSADVLVAEVSTPSLGVGYEIGRVVEKNLQIPGGKRRILCLYKKGSDKKLSSMIRGSPEVKVEEYSGLEEAERAIDRFFQNLPS